MSGRARLAAARTHRHVARRATSTCPTATAIRTCPRNTRPTASCCSTSGRARQRFTAEFNIAHDITCDADGWVYVADRENRRQSRCSTRNGRSRDAVERLAPAVRPVSCPPGETAPCATSVELVRHRTDQPQRFRTSRSARLTIVDHTGQRIARLGGLRPGLGPTEFLAPHGLAVDSRRDLYVGGVSSTGWPRIPAEQAPARQSPARCTSSGKSDSATCPPALPTSEPRLEKREAPHAPRSDIQPLRAGQRAWTESAIPSMPSSHRRRSAGFSSRDAQGNIRPRTVPAFSTPFAISRQIVRLLLHKLGRTAFRTSKRQTEFCC